MDIDTLIMIAKVGALVFGIGAVVAVGVFVVYAIEHSPTARRGKYTCYASDGGKLCMNPISAERARSGRDCSSCEARIQSSEDK